MCPDSEAGRGLAPPSTRTPATAVSLRELLQLEDTEQFANECCPSTGIPVWSQIRVAFLRAVVSDLFYSHPLDAPARPRGRIGPSATMFRSMLRAGRLLRASAVRAEVCLFATGVGHQRREGRWFNRLSDHFALAVPGATTTVEDHFEWRWPEPRVNPRVLYHAPLQAVASIIGRRRADAQVRRVAERCLELAIERTRSVIAWDPAPGRLDDLRERLARRVAALPLLLGAYTQLLRRVAPRVVIVEEACYGGAAAALMVAARQAGARTAEYQHGVISAGHVAYNVGAAWGRADAVRRTLPEFLLTYGDWWGQQLAIPVRSVSVGNPHRSDRLGALSAARLAERTVLILSDGTEFVRYLSLARAIARTASSAGLRVLVRPHPLERASAAQSSEGDVAIDMEPDLYNSVNGAHLVVSEVSTGMLESVGLAERVLVWSTPKSRFSFPGHPFASFETEAELVTRLPDPTFGALAGGATTAVWADQWRARYVGFLESLGVRSAQGRQ